MWSVCMIFECSNSSLRILADVASSTFSCASITKDALSTKIKVFIIDQDSSKALATSKRTVHASVTPSSFALATLRFIFQLQRGLRNANHVDSKCPRDRHFGASLGHLARSATGRNDHRYGNGSGWKSPAECRGGSQERINGSLSHHCN